VGAANGVHAIVAKAREQGGRIDQVAEDNDCNPTHRAYLASRRVGDITSRVLDLPPAGLAVILLRTVKKHQKSLATLHN
jgi:hypothetical protein